MKNKIVKKEIFNSEFDDIIQDITRQAEEFFRDQKEREIIDTIFAVAKGKWQTYNDYMKAISCKKYPFVLSETAFYYIKFQCPVI